jgi:Putative DNA-binding domain
MLMLRDLQSSFCRSVMGAAAAELLQLIYGDGFDPSARLSIYRNNVVARLTDALSATFPVVCKLVDRRFFAYVADTFIKRNRPAGACLVEYGADFPSFLAEFPPAAKLKYLADVARLEWIIHRVLRFVRQPGIAIAALGEVRGDPARISLRITPSIRFVASPYAIDQIWMAHQRDDTWADLRLPRAGVHLQVSGSDGVHLVRLPPPSWEFRSRLADGETLGKACAMATAISSDFDLVLALASLFNEGLVAGLMADSGSSGS